MPLPTPDHETAREELPAPPNVVLARGARIIADPVTKTRVFARFRSRRDPALTLGENTLADGVSFNLDPEAVVTIGRGCHLIECFLLAGENLLIGDHVTIGWHATVLDSDFHPVAPAPREVDVLALSPLGDGRRPPVVTRPVTIGDGAWIGPLAVILKGVRIGAGARIEPGAVVSRDVPAGARVLGNPATLVPPHHP